MITASELDTELRAIRDRVRRIRPPLAKNPEAFHLDKDAIASLLGELLGRLAEVPKARVLVSTAANRRPSGAELTRRVETIETRRGARRIEVGRIRRV